MYKGSISVLISNKGNHLHLELFLLVIKHCLISTNLITREYTLLTNNTNKRIHTGSQKLEKKLRNYMQHAHFN